MSLKVNPLYNTLQADSKCHRTSWANNKAVSLLSLVIAIGMMCAPTQALLTDNKQYSRVIGFGTSNNPFN